MILSLLSLWFGSFGCGGVCGFVHHQRGNQHKVHLCSLGAMGSTTFSSQALGRFAEVMHYCLQLFVSSDFEMGANLATRESIERGQDIRYQKWTNCNGELELWVVVTEDNGWETW